jgi:membrane-bound metal-dependent hydrolase YbcI (DUF457 family)
MITRHHIVLALLCSLIASAVSGFNPVFTLVLMGGTVIGVILPDIHMKRPARTRLLTVAWYLVQLGKFTGIPLMCGIYRNIFRKQIDPEDKRLTHSLPGIFAYFTLVAGVVSVPFILVRNSIPDFPAALFLGGVLFGLILHLLQDLCTRKGISILYPFSETMIHGSIRPCNFEDNRILQFQVQHCFVLGIIVVLDMIAKPSGLIFTCGILGIGICGVSMVLQSDIEVGLPENRPGGAEVPG